MQKNCCKWNEKSRVGWGKSAVCDNKCLYIFHLNDCSTFLQFLVLNSTWHLFVLLHMARIAILRDYIALIMKLLLPLFCSSCIKFLMWLLALNFCSSLAACLISTHMCALMKIQAVHEAYLYLSKHSRYEKWCTKRNLWVEDEEKFIFVALHMTFHFSFTFEFYYHNLMWGDASENDVLNGCENLNLFLLDFYKFEFLTAKFEFLSVSRFILLLQLKFVSLLASEIASLKPSHNAKSHE